MSTTGVSAMEDTSVELQELVMTDRQVEIISARKKRVRTYTAVLNGNIMDQFPQGSSKKRVKKAKYQERKRSFATTDSEPDSGRKRFRSSSKAPKRTPESRTKRRMDRSPSRGLYLVESDVESVKSFASSVAPLDKTFNEDGLRVPKDKLKKWSKKSKSPKVSTPATPKLTPSSSKDWDGKEIIKTLPNNVKAGRPHQRACLGCAMVKNIDQFYTQGCNNCEQFVHMKGCWQNIKRCSSDTYSGLIALMNPLSSEIECINNIDIGYVVPGMYAASVCGTLPRKLIQRMAEKGIVYKRKFNENDRVSDRKGHFGNASRIQAEKMYTPEEKSGAINKSFSRRRKQDLDLSDVRHVAADRMDVSESMETTFLDTVLSDMDKEFDERIISIYKRDFELPTPKKRNVMAPFKGEPSANKMLKPEVASFYCCE